jgi:phosphoglucosamine mutase
LAKLFGTDGVRGIANLDLNPELALKLGYAGAKLLAKQGETVIIGRDTRYSGDLLESALSAGVCSSGSQAAHLGVVPTPTVAYLTKALGVSAGVVISASHNPAKYNGIKFFDKSGMKLAVEQEEEIEKLVATNCENQRTTQVGKCLNFSWAVEEYISYAKNSIDGDLKGLRIALDCANGAAYRLAPVIMGELGAKLSVFADQPDGVNINEGCGSTNPQFLAQIVKRGDYDIGLAFDGDADRVIAIDEKGKIVDGDFIMAICALHLLEIGELKPKKIVTTVMTNMGFDKCMNKHGIEVVKTPVGDRHVLQEMLAQEAILGGEQSGHIIFSNHNSTGDGIITALQLLSVLVGEGKKLSQLTSVMRKFPQVLENVDISGLGSQAVLSAAEVKKAVDCCNSQLNENGRVLVRASGTEPVVRVMVEADSQELATDVVSTICQAINKVVRS